MKVSEEMLQILRAYDRLGSYRAAARECECSHNTVKRYVARRGAGRLGDPLKRPRGSVIDPFRPFLQEWVAESGARVRGDVAYRRLGRLGYRGSERTVRRALKEVKKAWRKGNRRVYRPWLPEPGKWAQYDWADGPRVAGSKSYLFCAHLSFSRYRVVIPTRNKRIETLIACLDRSMRAFGGAPSYWLTDNERTVTAGHVASLPVRNRLTADFARHYGVTIATCVPRDPQSKGGSEANVRIGKDHLVPTDANLLPAYAGWDELADECEAFLVMVNNREHSVTCRVPNLVLGEERRVLHPLPREPFTAVFGKTLKVAPTSVVSWKKARYSVPHRLCGESVWVREDGGELAIVADEGDGPREVARHRLRGRGQAAISEAHYTRTPEGPLNRRPRPRNDAEREFLQIGPNAERWLRAAAASGASRLGAKLVEIVDLCRLAGKEDTDLALGVAAECGRFGFGDIAAIVAAASPGPLYRADGDSFLQGGTGAWQGFGANENDNYNREEMDR